MPFIQIKVAGVALTPARTVALQRGVTELMEGILRKKAPLTAVLVEEVALAGWTIGAQPVARAAHVDATVGLGSNSADEKARFIAGADALLRAVLGAELPLATYVVIHELARESWGYGGLTQEQRAQISAAS